MNGNEIQRATRSPFDAIRRVRPDGSEFWSARDLQPLLGYIEWRKFEGCIEEARHAAEIAAATDQFVDAAKMVEVGSGAHREVKDVHLTRYACYMVAMSCDGRKPEVAAAKTYFAIRTREAETAPAPKFVIPQTMGEALRLAADQFDRAELEAARADAAESKVAELEPKADLADAILIAQGGARLVGQAAKLFAMKEKDFRRFLLDEKLVFTRHAPCGAIQWEHYAEFAHHFQARETVVNHTYGTCTHYTLRILPRGIELIRKRMREAGMLDLATGEAS